MLYNDRFLAVQHLAKRLGSLENTPEANVVLGYRLEQLLCCDLALIFYVKHKPMVKYMTGVYVEKSEAGKSTYFSIK